MKTYIALLRGINVGGHRKIKMVDLKELLNKMGMKDVATYIQSGNVVFKSSITKTSELEEKIKKSIAKTFSLDVPVLVKTHKELKSIFDKNPFAETSDIEHKRIYFALLKETPQPELIAAFQKVKFLGELFVVAEDCVYLNYSIGVGKAKLSNNFIERKLKVSATARNFNTMVKLLEMSTAR